MRLKDIREDHDMTQKDLAALLHIKQNTLSQYENGVREMPLSLLIRTALIFNTSSDYILEVTDDPEPHERSGKYKQF